jgi:hypothetical protein
MVIRLSGKTHSAHQISAVSCNLTGARVRKNLRYVTANQGAVIHLVKIAEIALK